MNKPITNNAPHSISQLGQWIARCGPKGKPATFSLVILFGLMAIGIATIIAGVLVQPKPGNETPGPIFIAGGGAVVAICLLCYYVMVFSRHPQVDLYDHGIHFQTKRENEIAPWNQMRDVAITKIYDTRFSSFRSVRIWLTNDRDFSFDSRLQGQTDQIIDTIANTAPNVKLQELSLG